MLPWALREPGTGGIADDVRLEVARQGDGTVLVAKRLWVTGLVVAMLAACSAPTATEQLADARAALAGGDARTAEIHLKSLLQLDGQNAAARLLLAEALLINGDPVGAAQQARAALELGADARQARALSLRALFGSGDFAGVLATLAAGPAAAGPERAAELALTAAAERGLGALDRAEAAYRAALALDPTSTQLRTELASLLFELRRRTEASQLLAAVLADEAAFSPALLVSGALALDAGRYVEAVALFRRAVESERGRGPGPLYGVAQERLITALLAMRSLPEARVQAEALLALAPRHPAARYLMARVDFEDGNLAAAEERLLALAAELPEDQPISMLLGAASGRQGRLGQAEMYLRAAVNRRPTDVTARLLLAEVYLRQGNAAAARDVLASAATATGGDGLVMAHPGRSSLAAGAPDAAAQYFAASENDAVRSLPELVDTVGVYLATGELDRAARVLQAASFDSAESDLLVGYLLAVVHLQRGDVPAAEATANGLLERYPETAAVATLRASIAARAGDAARARELYESALGLDAGHLPALVGLARVAFAGNALGEAEAYLRRAIEIDERHGEALLGLAQLAIVRGDFAEAEQWLAGLPESPVRRRMEVELALARGTRALERGGVDEAIAAYETVLTIDANQIVALNNLAWILGERGDGRALEFAARARELRPDNASILDTLGWLYVRGGEAARGLPLLEQAASALAANAEVQYHLAIALADTGAAARAAEVLARALALGGEFPSRVPARAKLDELKRGGG